MSYYRRRLSPIKPDESIDYKDVDLLRKFITERGKDYRPIQATRFDNRLIARIVALLPFINAASFGNIVNQ